MASSVVATANAAVAFKAPSSSRCRSSRAQRLQLVCSAAEGHAAAAAHRRRVLLGLAGAVVAAPLLGAAPVSAAIQVLPAASLSTFQRKDLLENLQGRAEAELKNELTDADAPACLRLLLNDAGTYDIATKTGGCDGSVVLPEELNRPENAGLKPIVEKLAKARAAIHAAQEEGQRPLTWADTIVLAAKVSQELSWRQDKINKAASPEKGAQLADGFGNPIRVKLGRLDAGEPAPAGRLPTRDAPLEEVQQFFFKLGSKPEQLEQSGPFGGKKPPFWERQQYLLWSAAAEDPAATEAAMAAFSEKYASWKKAYDVSKKTVTRTNYEEDLGATLALLASQGAKFDKDAYICDIKVNIPDRF